MTNRKFVGAHINDDTKFILDISAAVEQKSVSQIIADLIDEYLSKPIGLTNTPRREYLKVVSTLRAQKET